MQHKKLITAFTFLCVIGSTSLVIGEETLRINQFQQERDADIITINTELNPGQRSMDYGQWADHPLIIDH